MKLKKSLLIIAAASVSMFACKKKDDNTVTVTSQQVVTDFVNKMVLPQYANLQAKAAALNTAVNTLNTSTTNTNLEAARAAWRDVRSGWEQCEGFLIGPVEDDNYDPNMDTWPMDYQQLDSFTASGTSFSADVLQSVSQSLRGFHPLESILWGTTGAATADSITAKQKQYMVGLAQDILNTCTALNNSWAASGGNFQAVLLNAGAGSTRFTTRKQAMLAIVAGISDICGEVGGGKLLEPFEQYDSTKTESPFSHNSITDFINNIKGAQNVYLCSYNGQTGASMSNFIAARNIALDTKIKNQFSAAITALSNISTTFESAIYSQRTQLQNAMNAINELQATMDDDAKKYVQTYVTD
jgi:putative iron-regulated protein